MTAFTSSWQCWNSILLVVVPCTTTAVAVGSSRMEFTAAIAMTTIVRADAVTATASTR